MALGKTSRAMVNPFKDNGLLFWVPGVLCQCSEVFVEVAQHSNDLLMNL